jgi:phosphoribosyl 1,2-cyclic phosphodiesterase
MKLVIGGIRGSYPVAQPGFMKYGGETTSLLIEGRRGERIMIDAGTGSRVLGARLAARPESRRLLWLMTHYHLDHVVGLPSFSLIYDPRWTIEIAAPAHDEYEVEGTMSRVMDKPFWPLQVTDLRSRIRFRALEGEVSVNAMGWGALGVRWCPVQHPGGCTAYRIDEPETGASVVIATDVEWGLADETMREHLRNLCRTPAPADMLLMDAHYTPDEIDSFRGWGHSTWADAIEVARACGVPRVRLIHHDPRKDDEALDRLNASVAAANPDAYFARAGEEIDVRG